MANLVEKIKEIIEKKDYVFSKADGIQNEEDIVRLVEELISENKKNTTILNEILTATMNVGKLSSANNARIRKIETKVFEQNEDIKEIRKKANATRDMVAGIWDGKSKFQKQQQEDIAREFRIIRGMLRHLQIVFKEYVLHKLWTDSSEYGKKVKELAKDKL